MENIGVAGLVMAWFALLVSGGLRKRQARAFEDNWYIVFGEPVLVFLGSIQRQPTVGQTAAWFLGALLGLMLLWLAWSYPNYIYFKKREQLFH